ncbi:MAG TPA: HAD family hydrolase [Stellaceae bacterium]|nr:HAD family hydrolase [Stellaceae bacterium]
MRLSADAPNPAIRALLFDKDGTLIDYGATWAPINLKAASLAAGSDSTLARCLLVAGGADPATGMAAADTVLAAGSAAEIARCWIDAGAAFATGALTRVLDDLFAEAASSAVPLTDLPALFGRLKGRGLGIGIASTDNECAIRATLAHLGLTGLVDFAAGYDSGYGSKPDPGMGLAFRRALGLDAAQIAVIGDNAHDMRMGRAAGAGLVIGVLSGTGTRETLAPLADLCLASVAGIEAVLGPS